MQAFKNNNQKGFSLLEVVITLGIIATLATIVVPSLKLFQYNNEIKITESILGTQLNQARTYARARFYDSGWSVEVDENNGTITLFQGFDKASAPVSTKREFVIPKTVTLSAGETFQFEKKTGIMLTGEGTTINIVPPNNLEMQKSLRVQEYGFIHYLSI